MRVFNLLRTRIEEMEDNADVEGLIHALNDDSENVRREAVLALERIGDVRATEPLIQKLQDPDKTIQEEAITALGRIQDKKAVPVLIQTLNNKFIGIRWRAAEALGKIGDQRATEPLIQKLQDHDQTIQEEAITALGRIQDKKAVPALIQTLTNPSTSIRSRAIEALGKIGDPQATESIIMTLHDSDKTIQEAAITALGRIAVDPLVQDLKSDDQKLKETAIISLNHLREFKVSEPEIQNHTSDNDSNEELIDRIIDEVVSNEKSDFQLKTTQLKTSGFYVYLENFVKNSRYNYLDGFNNRSRYDYEFIDIKKLRNLLEDKGINFTEEEVTWLIQAEIENQEYLEFEAKILAQKPENLNQYIETMIKIYPEPLNHIEDLKKLLKQQNINHNNLKEEIEKIQKQMEITEFENKLMAKNVEESILPFEMQDMDYVYTSFNLGNLYFDIGKTDKALSYYDKALYVYPDFVNAWKNMGLIYFTMGRLQKAAACYNQILLLDPDYPELWTVVGLIFFEIDRVTEAKLCYERAKELNPCYKTEDMAIETLQFLKNRPLSLKKLNNYLELASSADWETSDPTPPLSRIMNLLNSSN